MGGFTLVSLRSICLCFIFLQIFTSFCVFAQTMESLCKSTSNPNAQYDVCDPTPGVITQWKWRPGWAPMNTEYFSEQDAIDATRNNYFTDPSALCFIDIKVMLPSGVSHERFVSGDYINRYDRPVRYRWGLRGGPTCQDAGGSATIGPTGDRKIGCRPGGAKVWDQSRGAYFCAYKKEVEASGQENICRRQADGLETPNPILPYLGAKEGLQNLPT